jgi:hypothetical protein
MTSSRWSERFETYFSQEVAQRAAESLSNGIEIQLEVDGEFLTFTKADGKNQIIEGKSKSPQLEFIIPRMAAETILNSPAQKVGEIGVEICKLIVSQDPTQRIQVKFKCGFFTLFSMGYLGVLKTGGAELATFLASKGLGGIDAIKKVLNKK